MTSTEMSALESIESIQEAGQGGESAVSWAIRQKFVRFARSSAIRLADPSSPDARALRETLARRTEFGPLLDETTLGFNDRLAFPFVTRDGCAITLHPDIVSRPAAGVVMLRQALEVALLQRMLRAQFDVGTQLVVAALGCHTAAAYLCSLPPDEAERAAGELPSWITELPVLGLGDADFLLAHVIRHAVELMALQAVDPDSVAALVADPSAFAMVRSRLTETLPLSYPAEWLLTQGGDNRLLVDPHTGLNKYGCSPKPRPWAVTFASCTSTSVSGQGFAAAEGVRRDLLLGAYRIGLAEAALDEAERIRRQILQRLCLDDVAGAEVVLTASGTDGELTALYFTLGDPPERVTNIVVAPEEVGGGTVAAAAGCHFDTMSPLGGAVQAGTPLPGFPVERVELVEVPIRARTGELLAAAELDRQIREHVGAACRSGRRVMLHLLDSSKTGTGAPSVETAVALKQAYGDRVTVIVDAAQMRLSRQALRRYVGHGFMVLVTGSKFFTGPPLSGALIVPTEIARRVDRLQPLPEGFAHYGTRTDFPARWSALARHLSRQANPGSLLRWGAALWEMEAFFAVPPGHRYETVRHFLEGVVGAIENSACLEFLTAPALERFAGNEEECWDRVQTIYSFFLRRPAPATGEEPFLSHEEALRVYKLLNADIASLLPATATSGELGIAAIRCHVGQPVKIYQHAGIWYSALRLAVGARLVSGVEFDPLLGETMENRLQSELDGALTIVSKLGVILRFWSELSGRRKDILPTQREGWEAAF
jgi:hypothetical protein